MSGFGDMNIHLDHAINSRELTNLEENHQFNDVGARCPKHCLFY